MANELQLRRGSTAAHATFVGKVGEVTFDTDKKTLVGHDGETEGGFPVNEGAHNALTNRDESGAHPASAIDDITETFDTVADMKAATWLQAGRVVEPTGYHVAGDGGQAKYLIQTSAEYVETPDELGSHTLANGKVAVLQVDNGVTVRQFGAVEGGVVDISAAIKGSITRIGYAYLPEGVWYIGAKDIDTSMIRGPGVLRSNISSGLSMPPTLRKEFGNPNKTRFTIEDEFGPHLTVGQNNLHYTGFASACLSNGYEVYAARTGFTHEAAFNYQTALVIYLFSKTKTPNLEKTVIYTTTDDIRDVNITGHPTLPDIVLIRFSELMISGNYQTRLVVYNVRTRTTESNRVISGMGGGDFTWGNSLITPQGYMLFCSYRTSGGGVDVWRTTAPLTLHGMLSASAIASMDAGTAISETTIGYWNDRIMMINRREGAAGYLRYSFNLENPTEWSTPTFLTGGVVHAPVLHPYVYNTNVFTFACSDGANRSSVIFGSGTKFDSFNNFKLTRFPVAGGETAIGGYPSLLDMGGYYAVSTYSDYYDVAQLPRRSRFERMEIDKKLVEISLGEPRYVVPLEYDNARIDGEEGVFVGNLNIVTNLYTSNARDYSIDFIVTKDLAIDKIYLLLKGAANVFVELYSNDLLIMTSSTVTMSASAPAAISLALPEAVQLSPYNSYNIKMKADAAFTAYDIRHNTRRGGAFVKFPELQIMDTKTNTGVSTGSTSFMVPAFRRAL